jgi:predicted Zn-ribbon and HTH transcriptional regulator
VIESVFRLGSGGTDDLRECRHCGTTVEEETIRCPECQSTEIASYSF